MGHGIDKTMKHRADETTDSAMVRKGGKKRSEGGTE